MMAAERVMAALQGRPVDRRPWAPLLSHYGAALTGVQPRDYYSRADAYIAGQRAVIGRFDPDVVYAPFALPLLGAAFGGTLGYVAEQAPNLAVPGLHRPQDLRPQAMPSVDGEPHLCYLRDCLRGLVAQCGSERPVAAIAMGPVDLPIMLFGLDRWLEIFLFEEDAAAQVLEQSLAFCQRWYRALFEDGAACVVLSAVFMVPEIITPELMRERAVPCLRRSLEAVPGPVILHHGGGRLQPYIDELLPLPAAVAGLAIDARDDAVAMRQRLGPAPALLVGLESARCSRLDVDAACAQMRALLASVADDPAVIIGSSGPDIPPGVPPELIDALRGVIEDAG